MPTHSFEKYHGKIESIGEGNKIILLFGWFGSTHKNLSKYSQFYKKLGFTVVQFTPSNFDITNTKHYTLKMKDIVDLLEKDFKISEKTPHIYLHVFSNHGLKNYISLLDIMEEKEYEYLKTMIKGVIKDSCPVNITAKASATAVTAHYKNPIFLWVGYGIFYAIFWIFLTIRGFFTHPINDSIGLFKLKKKVDHPSLYIYSVQDSITDHKFLEDFIEEKKGEVHKKKFSNSKHVSHYQVFPEEYEKEIQQFLAYSK